MSPLHATLLMICFSDANLGNNLYNGWSTSSYIVMMANATISFKGGTAGADRTVDEGGRAHGGSSVMKEAVFYFNVMLEPGFDNSFCNVPLYIDNTLALLVAGNRIYSLRAKHIALKYSFFVQELVGSNINIHYVKSKNRQADLGTKHPSNHRHHNPIKPINEFKA